MIDEEMTLAEKRVAAFVTPLLMGNNGQLPKVTLYHWEVPDVGYRLAELSAFWVDQERGRPFGCGSSWMQSDMDAGAVVFAAERLVLAYQLEPVNGPSGSDEVDDTAEAEEALRYLLTGP